MSTFEFSVPTLFGLEGIAGDELRRLDIENVRVENGRVLFSGDQRALAKANVCLRTGERVLLVLADFRATTFEQLFQGVYNTNLPSCCVRSKGIYRKTRRFEYLVSRILYLLYGMIFFALMYRSSSENTQPQYF